MLSQSDTTSLPSPEVQVQKKPTGPSGKKSRKGDDALEKLSVVVRVGDWRQIFELAIASRRKAERRITMLGEFAKKRLRALARGRYIPKWILTTWKHDYLLYRFGRLLPQDWLTLQERSRQKVLERLEILGELPDAATITGDDVYKLSQQFEEAGKFRVAERLVRCYQIYGVWGLASERVLEQMHRPHNQAPPFEYAAAKPVKRAETDRRFALITPFIGRRRIPNEDLKVYATEHSTEEHSLSWRTLRYYLTRYKKWRIAVLLP